MRILHQTDNKYKVISIFNEDLDEARFVCYASSDNNEKERKGRKSFLKVSIIKLQQIHLLLKISQKVKILL